MVKNRFHYFSYMDFVDEDLLLHHENSCRIEKQLFNCSAIVLSRIIYRWSTHSRNL